MHDFRGQKTHPNLFLKLGLPYRVMHIVDNQTWAKATSIYFWLLTVYLSDEIRGVYSARLCRRSNVFLTQASLHKICLQSNFKAFLTDALLAVDMIHLLLIFSSSSLSLLNGIPRLLSSSYSLSYEKQYNRDLSIPFSIEVISGPATDHFSNACGESRILTAALSILKSLLFCSCAWSMEMLEKFRVVFLTVKWKSENCTMKEHDHAGSPNLKDKQATISHNVHSWGQTSKEQ